MPPAVGRQFQQLLAAREEHVTAHSGDVNPYMASTAGTQQQAMGWRVRHKDDTGPPQPIRGDNFGTLMFKQETEFKPVKGYSGVST